MKRFFDRTRREEGQSLVVMAAAMLALMAFLGLSVDGGTIYLQRRNVQNAADGTAMAGAIAMAQNRSLSEAALCDLAVEYASERHGSDADLLEVRYTSGVNPPTIWTTPINCTTPSAATIPSTANGVAIRTGHNWDSYFAKLIGRDDFTVWATAIAQFGAPKMATGMHPLVVHESKVPPSSDFGDENKTVTIPVDKDGVEIADPSIVNDIPDQHRGWIDLPCYWPAKCNHGEDDIKHWMEEGYNGQVAVDYNIQSAPGTKAVGLHEPYVYEGKIMYMPVFDYVISPTNDEKCNPASGKYDAGWDEDQCHPNPRYGYATVDLYDATADSKRSRIYYHIVGFAALKVTNWEPNTSNRYISGYFVNYVATGELSDSGTSSDYGVTVIKMTR